MGKIVVGVDGSAHAARALIWAAEEASRRGWTVTAVLAWTYLEQRHADGEARFDPDYRPAEALAALDAYVIRAVGSHRLADCVERKAVCDRSAPALLEASAGAELLVVGARGLGGFKGLLLGSVSQHCLHHATCPVAIVRPVEAASSDGSHAERIVVGIDGSHSSQRALRWALDDAGARHAAVDVVHAWQFPYTVDSPFPPVTVDPLEFENAARALLDSVVDDAGADVALPVNRVLIAGEATSALLGSAKGADLLVVGSRGLGGFAQLLLGSVSHQLATHAPCTVVVVPDDRS